MSSMRMATSGSSSTTMTLRVDSDIAFSTCLQRF
jgi:hypothetical protein